MNDLQTIEPSTFVSQHKPYLPKEKMQHLFIPNTPEFRARLYEAQTKPVHDLLKDTNQTVFDTLTIVFTVFGLLTLTLAITTFVYVQNKKPKFFDTESQNIRALDVNGIYQLGFDEANLHILAFPTLKTTINTNDQIILPQLYDIHGNEMFPTGTTVGISCAYYTPNYPEVPQTNPPYYYVDVWKYANDTNLNIRLNEGQGVIYNVGRVNNVLKWFLIRTNTF